MNLDLKEKISRNWDESAALFDQQYGHGLKSEYEKTAWVETLKELVGQDRRRILDVGTGTGFLALLLAELGYQCTGVDLSQEMLKQAQKKARQAGMKIDFSLGDAEKLPFDNGTFDVIINRHLLWTLTQPKAALKEWVRVLNPGGKVIIIDGIWNRAGVLSKLRRLLGNSLVALIEGRNPWKGHGRYEKAIQKKLPFMGGANPNDIRQLMESAGLTKVRIEPLNKVVEAQKKGMPLRYRLIFNYQRYIVTGIKPK
jgi:ubiquinone/menaquinone biosynthesis C-methylase UbiE